MNRQILFHFWRGLLVLMLAGSCAVAAADTALQTGDLIFQTSLSAQSQAIQNATRSPYSHMGVILVRHGRVRVLEAAGPVHETPLPAWIRRGRGGHYVVKRLLRQPDAAAQTRLLQAAGSFLGKPYDPVFEWSDTSMYCSELVWKLYDRALGIQIGHLQQLRDFRLDDPVVRSKMRERYGQHLPLDEAVISPAAMFAAETLFEVVRR